MDTTTTPTPTSGLSSFNWKDFLSFKTMITLHIIQIVYVVVAIVITIAGLSALFSRDKGYYDFSLFPSGPLAGFVILIFGNVAWRIWCELVIVFFRINKTLSNIDDKTKA